MDSPYYRNGLRPVLLRSFKKSCNDQAFKDDQVAKAVNQHQDPIDLLHHLRNTSLVTVKELNEIIEPMLSDIQEIIGEVNYYQNGATVPTVTSNFSKLMRSIKAREEKGKGGAVPVLEGCKSSVMGKGTPQAGDRLFNENKEEINNKVTQVRKVEIARKCKEVVKHEGIQPAMAHKNNRDNEEEMSEDIDWEVLEDSDVHDFVVVGVEFEL